jgi:hypothetical protein
MSTLQASDHFDCGKQVGVMCEKHSDVNRIGQGHLSNCDGKLHVDALLLRYLITRAAGWIAKRANPGHDYRATLSDPCRRLPTIRPVADRIACGTGQAAMHLNSSQHGPLASGVTCGENTPELKWTEVAPLVCEWLESERFTCCLVGVLPVDEDSNADQGRPHKKDSPPVRPRPNGGEQ